MFILILFKAAWMVWKFNFFVCKHKIYWLKLKNNKFIAPEKYKIFKKGFLAN